MCRNIRTLYNFEPPATDAEVRSAAEQYVRKISGFSKPSQANAEAFERAIEEVAEVSARLLGELVTNAPPKDREVEAARARARAALRDDLYSLHRSLTAEVLRDSGGGGTAAARVDGWVERNPASERCLQTLAEIRVGHVFDTTTLPVAVREVRNLLMAGRRP